MDAKKNLPKKDSNGKKCAIIKVATTQTGLSWESDRQGIVATITKEGEQWLYVPYTAQHLTIKYAALGISLNYTYPVALQKASVYKLEVKIIPKPHVGSIRVTSVPETEMAIYLDDVNSGKTTTAILDSVASGEHTIRLLSPHYHPQSMLVLVTDDQTTHADFNMKSEFAFITIYANPNAYILIDSSKVGKGIYTARVQAGVYAIKAETEKYKPQQQVISLEANSNHTVTFNLKPRMGSLHVTSNPPMLSIYLNGKYNGRTPKTIDSLLVGDYTIMINKYKPNKTPIEVTKTVTIEENKTTEVDNSLPTKKEVTITSFPEGAHIWVNGKAKGSTPYTATLSNGTYLVRLENGSKTVEHTIIIAPDVQNRYEYEVNGGVKDADGNLYNTIKIGNQEWMTENLKTTRYRNGKKIRRVSDSETLQKITTGAYTWYQNDTSFKNTYGALYNYYAVVDSNNLCPAGWHVPTNEDWLALNTYLGGGLVAGCKMKDAGLWRSSYGGSNSSGFSAIPLLDKASCPTIQFEQENEACWWSSSEASAPYAWMRAVCAKSCMLIKYSYPKFIEANVRCIKDR
jgi:PEGA domain./Fibrobacter succinogenes major domain (Fib_succ_major).